MSSRTIGVVRVVLLVAIVGWFFSPPDWRYAVPLWLPFVAAVALELEFAVSGWRRRARSAPAERRRAPQQADLDRFGWRGETPDEDDPAFWISSPVPRLRSSTLARIVTSLAVIGVVALAGWAISVQRGWSALDHGTQVRTERVLSLAAGRIAGHAVRVQCDTSGRHVGAVQETDGLAEVGGRNAWLTPGICFRLHQVIDGHDRHPANPAGRAITVLAHEAWHLHGVADEGITNCYAFQSGVAIGVRFGLPADSARALMREQLADNASDSEGAPAYRVPSGCSNGGRYDLHPNSAQFP